MHRTSDDPNHSPGGGQPDGAATTIERPGSAGEHQLQQECGTQDRANRFYRQQMGDRINAPMREFIGRMEMAFIATADAHGECDASFRAGPPGFRPRPRRAHRRLARVPGHGRDGQRRQPRREPACGHPVRRLRPRPRRPARQRICELMAPADFARRYPADQVDIVPGRRPERWIVVTVEEAYIHCSKHIPEAGARATHAGTGAPTTPRRRAATTSGSPPGGPGCSAALGSI